MPNNYPITVYALEDALDATTSRIDFVICQNGAPRPQNDIVQTSEDTILVFRPLQNDADIENDPLTIESLTSPSFGAVTFLNGDVTYTPNANVSGTDKFSYIASDGKGPGAKGEITIEIAPVNDDPVVVEDTAVVDEDGEVTINVLANDSDVDGDSLAVEAISAPDNGARKNLGNAIWYKPKKDFNGVETFRYRAADGKGGTAGGKVTVTVNPVNDAPAAGDDVAATSAGAAVTIDVLANDSDIDGDSLVIEAVNKPANGTARHDGKSVTYTPKAGFTGTDSFRYRVGDGKGGKAHGNVTVTVAQ